MAAKFCFKKFSIGLLAAILLGCHGSTTALNAAAAPSLYTRYNIHVQDQIRRSGEHIYKASYANYTNPGKGHLIIPAGSEIEVTGTSRKELVFRVPARELMVHFEYHEPRMGMGVEEYLQKITSTKPLPMEGLSAVDRQGVAEGKALPGMSREGVRRALGYPATHRTPSLESSTYVYWTNRFGTIMVHFDQQGKVKEIVD